jgi:vacuolar-type H+-ATPase subunit E/Vma4
MVINEDASNALKEQLKNISNDVVELIEKISESSLSEAENAFKVVSLKKPKLLGKGKYIETLGDIMKAIIRESGNAMNNLDLRERLFKRYPDAEISFEDMEKAARQLLDKRLIHGIREEEKHYVIELRKSDQSPTCGNCKKSGGFMTEYFSCPKGFVCSNCVSFFGSCKVCGSKLKAGNHNLIY